MAPFRIAIYKLTHCFSPSVVFRWIYKQAQNTWGSQAETGLYMYENINFKIKKNTCMQFCMNNLV